ncbi:Ig-like domain-containing protein [Nocardioides sp. GCM10030258]|uniref:L,D-transpeptidase n=1 Tax=unclassified Nocardioides TaxID=2615069 RepID=UPI003619F8E8
MSTTSRRATLMRSFAVLSIVAVVAAGCDGSGVLPGAGDDKTAETTAAAAVQATVHTNIKPGATNVPVDKILRVAAVDGTLKTVTVRSAAGPLKGKVDPASGRWIASDRLEPGVRYRVHATAANAEGTEASSDTVFTTRALSLAQQTYPSVSPLDGEKVGIGMPVVVTFDLPVTDKAAFEAKMKVTSTPVQAGSWRWVGDKEAHWRPRAYWKAGSRVKVNIDINSVSAGGGVYGQEDRDIAFTVGDAHVYKVNAKTHRMKVISNGKLLRTIPITTGKAGFITRSGTKVIMEKFATRRMNSETVGIPAGSSEAYDLDDVKWAMRLTNSGEFIHAAPWSVGSQGRDNVSHGCTGMSTANAAWLYNMTRRGDVVEYVGTNRPMESWNGYGDWNINWADYAAGSALS